MYVIFFFTSYFPIHLSDYIFKTSFDSFNAFLDHYELLPQSAVQHALSFVVTAEYDVMDLKRPGVTTGSWEQFKRDTGALATWAT